MTGARARKGGVVGRGACPPPASTLIPAGQAAREMVG
jgi:hypothetical protein